MPPKVALVLCFCFIGYIFWIDYKKKDYSSIALWIPFVWMFLAGSRYVSYWFGSTRSQIDTYHEGSQIDSIIFALLIAGGIFTLSKRKVEWEELLRKNLIVCLYLIYCGFSVLWSEYSFVSFKRWIKELGCVVMVLVILTEKRPYEAIDIILRRLAFVWLPLSALFFKYYPLLGRVYHPDGRQFATGVSMGKNGLGVLCTICLIYLSWKFIVKDKKLLLTDLKQSIVYIALIDLNLYLIYLSKSATAVACSGIAISLMLLSRAKFIELKPNRIFYLITISTSLFFMLDAAFDLRFFIYDLLGRDQTLTTRVSIWEFLSEMDTNPIIGTGFQSFWLGDRLEKIWSFTGRTINQAHNGYLEHYLNLGYIGVLFIVLLIIAGLVKVQKQLMVEYNSGILCLCLIVISVLSNYTEALFSGINNIWILTLFAIIEIPNADKQEAKINNVFGDCSV
jgi:O-antigen ligase